MVDCLVDHPTNQLFFLLRYFDILARMHGKEEGKNGELRDCTLELRQYSLGDLGNDAGGDGFFAVSPLGWHSCRQGTVIEE
jgi:hypothetical protein